MDVGVLAVTDIGGNERFGYGAFRRPSRLLFHDDFDGSCAGYD